MTKLYNEVNESILVIIKWQTSGWVCTIEKEACCMPALMSLSLSLKFVIFAATIFVSKYCPGPYRICRCHAVHSTVHAAVWTRHGHWRQTLFSGSPQIIGPVYGGIIVAAALKNLLVKPSEKPMSHWLSAVILIGAGIIHGMFASGGALLVVYLAATYHNKYTFRANVAAVWSCLNLVLMFKDFEKGMFNAQALHLMLIAIILLRLAVYIGNKIHSRINQRMFNYSTYCLLLLSGAMILL